MDKIDKIIHNYISDLGYEPILQMLEQISSGKKLRSKLITAIAGENEQSIRLCAIVEIIHLASLLHDDVIDESDTRRGKRSLNAVYGSKNAVMLGDILYSKGFNELVKFDNKIATLISSAVTDLSIGELMDVNLGSKFNPNKEAYERMIYLKTAVLIEASAASAALLAGFNIDNFASYGRNLGLAFQIIDDILDITQSSDILGKPSLHDFAEGKTTLPYIKLYESMDKIGKEKLKSLYNKKLDNNEVVWIKEQMFKFGAIDSCLNYARNLADQALKSILDYNNEKLENIIKSMIDRTF